MNTALTIQEKLKDLRNRRGLTLEQLAEQTGISKSALGNYESQDYKDISHTSIVTLAKFYGVSADYLLGLTESKNHPSADLDALHLSDDMIELLRGGKINARLLCEMAAHKNFVKLLADIEIYVDGIATMQIRNLNSVVDMARQEVIAKYQPEADDPPLRLLEAAHIEEDDYFCERVHDDIDSIIRDIRQAHKSDSTSAPETTAAMDMKTALDEAATFKGSAQEKQLVALLRQLGIDYNKLTAEEFRVMVQVMNKSRLLKSAGHKRVRGAKR